METFCSGCKRVTPIESGFCKFCGSSLNPSQGIRLSDYQVSEDREAISNLEVATLLMPLAKHLSEPTHRNFEAKILRNSISLDKVPNLLKSAEKCARILSLERFPRIYVVEQHAPNAFAFGSDENPSIAITSSLLGMLGREEELRVILGHEMGHIKSKHITYHMLAETLATGTNYLGFFMLGRDLISLPLRMLLLAWHRASEVTADRASLLTSGDLDSVKAALAVPLVSRMSPDKARALLKREDKGFIQRLGEMLSTHPTIQRRIERVEKFYRSFKYRKIALDLWEKKLLLSHILCCPFCGEPNLNGESFCPNCGKCQI